MISLTAQALSEHQPPVVRAGPLASGAIYASELYQQHCTPLRIEILTPDQAGQQAVAGELVVQGAQAAILACTELPLVLRQGDLPVPVIDPTQVLAQAVVEWVWT